MAIEDVEVLTGRLPPLSPDLAMVFHPSKQNPRFSDTLLSLARGVADTVDTVNIPAQQADKDLFCTPALSFRHIDAGTILYTALPKEQEALPFRELLTGTSPVVHQLTDEAAADLKEYDRPVEIAVFITATCPHCPKAVRAAIALALTGRQVTAAIVDAEVCPELAGSYNIRSVPTTMINRELIINRLLTPQELSQWALTSATYRYREAAFLSMINTGNIDRATDCLIGDPHAVSRFLSVWKQSTFNSRMGLLLVAEGAMAAHGEIFHTIVPELVELLETEDIPLRGDTADLLGQIGHPEAQAPLRRLLRDANPDIAEIAADALRKHQLFP